MGGRIAGRAAAPVRLDKLGMATRVPEPLPPLEGFTFEGYRNADGTVGTKNVLGISTSVQCVAGTLEFAIRRIREELLPRYKNVDDVVGLTHAYGCGVAINAPEAKVPIRTLQNLARNPNFGGQAMVVGLGCEKFLPERLIGGEAARRHQIIPISCGCRTRRFTVLAPWWKISTAWRSCG